MLYEEADAFAMDDEDVGCIEGLQMNIHLTDDQPIQKNYLSIPRPLYPEVKAYIEPSWRSDVCSLACIFF